MNIEESVVEKIGQDARLDLTNMESLCNEQTCLSWIG